MGNPFDQFDVSQTNSGDANPFDQFTPPAQKASSPHPQTTDQGLGFYKGVTTAMDNAAKGVHWLLGSGALPGFPKETSGMMDTLSEKIGLPSVDEAVQEHHDYIAQQQAKGVQPGGWGEFAGDIVGTAPLLATGMGPIAAGATSGALLTEHNDPVGVLKDMAIGGAGGKLGDAIFGGAGKMLSAKLSPDVQQLLSEGVNLTPGQLFGGTTKGFEDKLTSVPFVGGAITGAKNRATETFNRAVANRVLDPLGQSLPKNVPAGHEMIDHVYNAIDQSYSNLLPKMTGYADNILQNDFNAIGQKAIGEGVKQDVLDRFNNVLQAQVKDRVINGQFTGQSLKDAQGNLGNIGRKMIVSQDADTREVGGLVMDAQRAFNAMLERHNPGFAQELGDTNKAFANYVRLRKAASYTGSKDGVFTAPQLAQAVQSSDRSAGKGSYARGKALMQDLSNAAKSVLPSSVNDSGTPGRLLAASPIASAKGLLASIPFSALYSPIGTRGLAKAVTSRGPVSKVIGLGLTAARSPAALGTSSGLAMYDANE